MTSAAAGAASTSSPFPPQTRRIPDDTISYSIYPDDPSSLHSLHLQILTSILPSFIPSTYIWQHEPFNLTPVASPIPHLRGSVRFGDNLDDEWLITALLFRISALVPSLSISVLDSDGDFLLIESAFHLPRWLRPDNSAHRIFIRNNLLHIIPKDLDPLTLQSSLNTLKSAKIDTVASDPIQSAIKNKISAYPERALANMHRARVRVPMAVAQVLKQEPCLVSLAVEGFYDRDIDSMKHAMKMERFLKEGEMVRTAVTMTRVMYGQLVQQSFQAPRCYPMPGRNEVGSEGFKEAEIGMKIACGLEMMYQERRKEGEEGKGGTWEVFLKSLEGAGFFEGLLPGSQEYKKKMEGAMEYYKNSTLASRTRDTLNAPVKRIDEILALPYSTNDFSATELPSSDDDSWLYNGEDELNAAIAERQKEMELYESKHKNRKSGSQEVKKNASNMQLDDFNFKDVADSMQAFIQKQSSFEGAEVPQNRNSNEVELDVERFFKDMESVVGTAWHDKADDIDEGSTSSSEMDFDEFQDGSDIAEPCGGDDNKDTFMESYSDVLNKELNDTTLKRSFIRASEQQPGKDEEGTSKNSKDMDEELSPVDVDVNLVKSFLDSFSSQEGLPGPASNLLGLMGLNLPHETNK